MGEGGGRSSLFTFFNSCSIIEQVLENSGKNPCINYNGHKTKVS